MSISIFLDSETAKIDALIAEQQRLIESSHMLQEKRAGMKRLVISLSSTME
jgi:hypothetical protein